MKWSKIENIMLCVELGTFVIILYSILKFGSNIFSLFGLIIMFFVVYLNRTNYRKIKLKEK